MQMRAMVSTGRSQELTVIGEVDVPTPAANEALVRVSEFSLNRADFLYLSRGVDGFCPGLDGAGVVEASAADGSGPAPGTRVAFHLPRGGAGAELAAVPTEALAPIPAEVSTAQAAALPLAGFVAMRLVELASPLTGATVLGTGVGGGVGQIAIQLAVAAGARVIALVAPGQAPDHVAAAGATVVNDIASVPRASVDVVLESVGGAVGTAAIHTLRPDGLFLWFGQSSGAPLTLDFFDVLSAGQSLTLRQFVYRDAADSGHDLQRLLALVADGKLTVRIGHHLDWSHAARLIDDMAGGRLPGKAVLTVS
jgi:NADPH:quinone reductase